MTQNEKSPGKYNPYKAAYYTRAPQDPLLEARMEQFWEKTRLTSPKLYQKHQREQAFSATQRPIVEALLDDPDVTALLDDILKHEAENNLFVLSQECALLGIEAGATKREIRNAYRRKARKVHPDVGGDAEAFKELYAAYRTLLKAARA